MRIVVARRREPDARARTPAGEPTSEPLDGDVAIMEGRRVVAVQRVLPASVAFDRLRAGLEAVRWENPITAGALSGESVHSGGRVSGIFAPHRTFGWVPPQVLRRRYGAMRAKFDTGWPDLGAVLEGLAPAMWDVTRAAMPSAARVHEAAARAVAPAWRLGGQPWTSGIINVNSALPYHRDSGNLAGCLSAMLALRRGVEGGALHLADYDLWLAVPDRSVIVFRGSTVLHGVSPLVIRPGGRRFTFVWYVRAQMTKVAPTWDGEVARAQLLAASHDQMPDAHPRPWEPELQGKGAPGSRVRLRGITEP